MSNYRFVYFYLYLPLLCSLLLLRSSFPFALLSFYSVFGYKYSGSDDHARTPWDSQQVPTLEDACLYLCRFAKYRFPFPSSWFATITLYIYTQSNKLVYFVFFFLLFLFSSFLFFGYFSFDFVRVLLLIWKELVKSLI